MNLFIKVITYATLLHLGTHQPRYIRKMKLNKNSKPYNLVIVPPILILAGHNFIEKMVQKLFDRGPKFTKHLKWHNDSLVNLDNETYNR